MKAEKIIINKISSAFQMMKNPTDEWISNNPYFFEEVDLDEAKEYLPAFMIYIIKNMKEDPQSMVYMQLLDTLNDYSKCKNLNNKNIGLWYLLSTIQQKAILAFLGHLLHNQAGNIDIEELQKIIKRWENC